MIILLKQSLLLVYCIHQALATDPRLEFENQSKHIFKRDEYIACTGDVPANSLKLSEACSHLFGPHDGGKEEWLVTHEGPLWTRTQGTCAAMVLFKHSMRLRSQLEIMTLRQVQNDIIAIIKQCTGQKKLAGEREVRRDVAGNTLWYHLWVTGSPNRPDYHFEEAIPYPEQAQVQAPPPIRPPSPEIPGVPPPPGSPPGPSQPQQVPEIQPQEPPGTPPHPLQAPAQQPGFASYYRSSPRPPPIPEQADLAAAIPQSPPGARLSSAHSDPGLHTDDAPTLSQIRGNRGMRHAASAADLRAAESYHDLQRIVIEQVGNVEAQIGQLMTRVVPAPTPSPDRHAWDDENVGECVKRLWVAYVTHGRACDECVRENPGCFGALTCLGLLGLTAGVGGFIHSWIPSHH